jgi:two-component system response regulator FixJ
MRTQPSSVFVVDDDSAVRGSLRLLLKSAGLKVSTYDSAQAFLDTYNDELTGCLLLDMRMPGMSGPTLQQQLNLRGSALPIIFITGHGDADMAVDAIQHGAFDFIQKPFHDQDLLDRVQQALKRTRS